LIPGAKAMTETAQQVAQTRAAQGDSATHGAMAVASGAVQLDGGKVWEGAKEVGAAALEGVKAVVSALNPLNWFAEGTNKIQKDGMAFVHEGEAIVPAEYVAQGSGQFDPRVFAAGLQSNDVASSPGFGLGPDSNLAEMADFIGTDAADIVASMGKVPTTATMRGQTAPPTPATADSSAVPIKDMYDRVNEKYATSEDKNATAPTAEMSRIAAATMKSNELLSQLHEDNVEIIKLLKPKRSGGSQSGAGAGPNPRTQRRSPHNSVEFGNWQSGSYQANASRQVVSNGL
jgi:hypothetical protein